MTKKIYTIAILTILSLQAHAQTFFNLTADQVRIDSVIPSFRHTIPLPDNYADSVYTVAIAYPEYVAMPETQVEKFISLHGSAAPTQPLISQQISMNRRKAFLSVDLMPYVVQNGKHKILASFMLKVKSTPRKGSRKAAPRKASKAERYAQNSVLAEGTWAKIRVPATGIYQLTDDVIRKAGFSDPSKVKLYGYGGNLQNEVLDGDYLAATDDLKEVPTCRVGGQRLFFARGPVSWDDNTTNIRTRNPYSDYGYYFITQGTDEPASIDSETLLAENYPIADDYHSLYEKDGYSWFHGGRNLFDPEVIAEGNSKELSFDNNRGATLASIYVKLTDEVPFSATVELNGEELGIISRTRRLGEYDKGCQEARTYVVKSPAEKNTIKITANSGGNIRIDYVSIAWDTPAPKPDLEKTTFPAAEYVYNITNQNHHAAEAADMVIIIPTSQKLRQQAERLKAFHEENDGLRVQIVPADELYNEFSSGTPDVNAYRRYMKMLYDRAENEADMPKYLLLFGDAVWDNRMLTSYCRSLNPDDYLLCFESENSFNKVNCYVDDGFFCLLDDGEGGHPDTADLLDVAVGRFPVTSDAEAKILVDKTIAYVKNDNCGPWQNTLVFLGDDGNNNLHMKAVDRAAEEMAELHPGFVVKKVMWDTYTRESSATGNTYPEVTQIVKQYQQSGALIIDYCGHGRENQLSHETILRLNDFADFTNTRYPLWITASCDIMPFDGVDNTIGETALLNEKGGTMAFFGTTRTVYAAYNEVINEAFLRHVMSAVDGKQTTLGEAQRLAKNECITRGTDKTENKLQYSLLGDPAIALNVPKLTAKIDYINDIPTSSTTSMPTLKAGTIARVKGHIENVDDFNGVFTAMVRDSREEISGRQNDTKETKTPFVYYDRTKTLYNGSDSVVAGKFEFSFPIPKDINYSDETGLINIFAVDTRTKNTANGSNDHFIVGGSAINGTDSIGPSIFCYLNNPSFVNGGKVNPTPYFVAEITDQDGINATGNGIGHNLELIIDGDILKTYVLNDNFTFDFGSYQSGSTFYNIPELTVGPHKLMFRAWDILNNSSVAELSFTVANGLEPNILNVSCTHNPATTNTTFIIQHDRSGSPVDIDIDIFDLSGRILWNHRESGMSSGATYTVDWDLTVDGGQRLQTGVYLYRARLSSDGSSKASKAKKLIIIGNN